MAFLRGAVVAVSVLFSGIVCAQDDSARILEKLRKANGKLTYSEPQPSGIPGVYEVKTGTARLFVSGDGGRFIIGDMFELTESGAVNLSAQARQKERADALSVLDPKEMIVFAPESPAKAVVYVFTDADCGFCRKLHNEIDELNEQGIEVRYLAFPRAGIGSESHKKLVWAYCAEDRKDAYTRLTRDKSIEERECTNPIEAQYKLGLSMGVSGTPTFVKPNGELKEGYQSPEQLAKALGLKK